MKRLLLLGFLFPVTTFAQVSYSVTVTRLKARADDCDGGIITLCGNAPQDPIFNIWSSDAEANENTYCWIFDNDPEAEYNLWKDIQNLEIANETNVTSTYVTFDMAGYESDNLNPGCTSSFGDDAVHDRQFVQQIDFATLTEGGASNVMVLSLNDVYFAEVDIRWFDLTATISNIPGAAIRTQPNPSEGNFKLVTTGMIGEREIEIRDMTGRLILSQTSIEDATDIQLIDVKAGTYFIRVSSQSGEVIDKIVVR